MPVRRVPIALPGLRCLNPSIARIRGGLECVVRTSNVITYPDQSYTIPDSFEGKFLLKTVNYLANVAHDFSLRNVREIVDRTGNTRVAPRADRNYVVHGYEDLRLFEVDTGVNGGRWALATVVERSPDFVNRMALCAIADDGSLTSAELLVSPVPGVLEKNWVPILGEPTPAWMYSVDPPVRGLPNRLCATFPPDNLRGGSQLLPLVDGGYLTVAHTMRKVDGRKVYHHYFMRFNAELQELERSDPWTFGDHPGIEYCAGMVDHGQDLVLSCAEGDASAFFAVLPRADVLRCCGPAKQTVDVPVELSGISEKIPGNVPILYAPIIGDLRPIFLLPDLQDATENAHRRYVWDNAGGAPEAALILWAESMVPPSAVLWDVGSHTGTWAILWGIRGHVVHAFEANHSMARLCNAGMILSGLAATCHAVAVCDHDGNAIFRNPTIDGGGGSLVRLFGACLPIAVPAVSLDTWRAHDARGVGFLKIDVEGGELDVLRGARRTIAACRPKILFECWEDERGQRKEELFRFLRDDLRYAAVRTSWPETWIADPL